MNKSEQINELADALTRFQSKAVNIVETTENKFLGTKYADLAAILAQARALWTEEGLSVAQLPVPPTQPGHCAVETVLMHKSGQWISGTLEMAALPNKGLSVAQGMGSAITYCRRYALAAMLGIAQTDDDGSGVTHGHSNGNGQDKSPSVIDSTQLDTLSQIIAQKKRPDLTARMCKFYKIDELSQLPSTQFEHCLDMLNNTAEGKAA